MLLWEIHILLWVFGMLLLVNAHFMKFWVINMLCLIISMLLWVNSVLLLNSSEVYPSARFTLNICHYSLRSAASLQSSIPSFPKTTYVRIASSIAVYLSPKLTQNNSLPADLLTNRRLRVTAVVTMRNSVLLWVIRMPFLELHWILLICTSQLLYLSLFIPWTTLLKSDQQTFSVLWGFKS